MKCMKKEGFRTLTREETLDLGWKSQGNEVWSEKEVFGGEKTQIIKRDRREMR